MTKDIKENAYVLITRLDDDGKLSPIVDSPMRPALWTVALAAPAEDSLTERLLSEKTQHSDAIDAVTRAHELMSGHDLPLVIDLAEIRLFDQRSISDAMEGLTEAIHDDLPGHGDEDFRDDDFENHDLSELREAFVDVAEEINNAPGLGM